MTNTHAQAFLLDYLDCFTGVTLGGGAPQLIYCPHCRYVAFTAEQIDRHCRQDHSEIKLKDGLHV